METFALHNLFIKTSSTVEWSHSWVKAESDEHFYFVTECALVSGMKFCKLDHEGLSKVLKLVKKSVIGVCVDRKVIDFFNFYVIMAGK